MPFYELRLVRLLVFSLPPAHTSGGGLLRRLFWAAPSLSFLLAAKRRRRDLQCDQIPRARPGLTLAQPGNQYPTLRAQISVTIAQHPLEKTEDHARDRSCFAQYRNNGFAAHQR
jgi:hypothetical protein